jgi:exosortase
MLPTPTEPPGISADTADFPGIMLTTALVVLLAVTFYPIGTILAHQWYESDDYSHAFLVIPIVGYILYSQKQVLLQLEDHPSRIGLAAAIAATGGYLVALHADIVSAAAFMTLTALTGVVVYLRGVKTLRRLLFPLLLLVLLIPIPPTIYATLTMPLQLKVSQLSTFVTGLIGVPVFREGNVISIPGRVFQVVEACSGMRSIMALTTLSLLLGYFALKRALPKIVLVAAALPTAIFINVIRVSLLILAYHYYKMDLTVGLPHTIIGMSVYLIALLILYLLLRIVLIWEKKSASE